MKMTDSVDLESAKLVEVKTTRMVSNPTMRIYLKAVGMFLVVYEISEGKWDIPILDNEGIETGKFTTHPAKELCLLIVKSLEGSTTDNNDFNFIVGHPKGDGIIADTQLFASTYLPTHKAQIETLLDIVISHCNIVTKPYENATQEQWDAEILETLLYQDTSQIKVGYPQFDSGIDYTVTLTNKPVGVAALLKSPAPVDMKFKVMFHNDYSESGVFETVGMLGGHIYIKKGETNGSLSYSNTVRPLSRKVQVSAICNVYCDYNLTVKSL